MIHLVGLNLFTANLTDFKNPISPPTWLPSSFKDGFIEKALMNVFSPSIIRAWSFNFLLVGSVDISSVSYTHLTLPTSDLV